MSEWSTWVEFLEIKSWSFKSVNIDHQTFKNQASHLYNCVGSWLKVSMCQQNILISKNMHMHTSKQFSLFRSQPVCLISCRLHTHFLNILVRTMFESIITCTLIVCTFLGFYKDKFAPVSVWVQSFSQSHWGKLTLLQVAFDCWFVLPHCKETWCTNSSR